MLVTQLRRIRAMFVAMPFGAKPVTMAVMTLLASGTAWLVYATGGVRFAYLHLMYVPVVLSALELEITESAVMVDPDHCIRLISSLRDRGYGVAIDDFGVGHSSLAYLQKLRVSALKIDQEFVKTLASDSNNQKIVRSILHLAQSLGLETVAEGVENERSVALLREWGCDYAQGYGVHRTAQSVRP